MPVLDTNVLIDLGDPRRRGHAKAVGVLTATMSRGEALCTTRFNVAELLVGRERALDRAAEERRVRRALSRLLVLEFDALAAEHFGRVQAYLLDHGSPVGDMDVLIASVAMTNGQSVVTRNTRHFSQIPGLQLESY